MATRTAQLVHHLQRLTAGAEDSDADLLDRFIQHRDQDAFARLVERYAPLVLRVCRRQLADTHTAEDCLQATFLVLARKAGSIRRGDALAAFLHGVACRIARKARASSRRAPKQALDVAPADPHPDPLAELSARELLAVLDEEIERLPDIYRLPVVLCCLEGLSLEEAAGRLGWTPGSVKGRLERGRRRLHDRLARRGFALGAVLATAAVSSANAPGGLLREILEMAGGKEPAARIAALAEAAFPVGGMLARLVIVLVLLAVGGAVGLAFAPARLVGPEPAGTAEEPPAREVKPVPAEQREPLPPGALARMGSVRFCPGSTIQAVAFAPDSKVIASGNSDGTVSLWEAATGKEVRRLRQSQTPVEAVAFSPDGKLLACRGQTGGLGLWDTATGKLVRRFVVGEARWPASLTGPPAWGFRIVFSPDGKTIAAASGDLKGEDSAIRLWDVATGRELQHFQGHEGAVRNFAFAPDGKALATGGADKTVRLWDPDTGKQRLVLKAGGPLFALAWSPDGKKLTAGGEDRAVHLWTSTGTSLRKIAVPEAVRSITFITDGTLAWGDEPGSIHLLDLKTEKETRQPLRHAHGVSDLVRSPDGKTLASVGGSDHAVHLWQLDTGKKLSPSPDAHPGPIQAVTFTPDGKSVVAPAGDSIHFWEPATGKELRRLEGIPAHALAFSADGKSLAVAADGGGTLRILDVATGKERLQVKHPGSGWFTSVRFAPDGKTLLAGGNRFDGQFLGFFLWDVATGKELRGFRGHTDNVKGIAFSPDGKTVASGGEDHTVRLWDAATGKELRRCEGHRIFVDAVAFSPDGQQLVSADARSIRVWEVATGKELRSQEIENGLAGIALSPDGKSLATGEYEPSIEGWVVCLRELATGKELRRWVGHRNTVSCLSFSPDGKMLASGSWDTLILVWDLASKPAIEKQGSKD